MKSMKVLFLGSGGREDAIHWKLASEGHEMFAAPGNPGTASRGKNVQLDINDPQAVADYVVAAGIEFTVVGPEAPLAAGIVDHFNSRNLSIFGPTKEAARLTEISKADCCGLLQAADVPIPTTFVFPNYEEMVNQVVGMTLPLVIKYDGLAAGKGVRVVTTLRELKEAWDFFRTFKNAPYLVQELVQGTEVSCFYYVDGTDFLYGGSAQDYKRQLDGNKGPNTGGMGGFSPHPSIDDLTRGVIEDLIVRPTIKKLSEIGTPYRGVMYFQLMLTKDGPVVIEINCRFGDPEAELLMPLLDCELLPIMLATTKDGELRKLTVKFKPGVSVGIVLASEGYPGEPHDNKLITMDPYYLLGSDRDRRVTVFQAGTKINEQQELRTKGGRVLTVVGRMPTYRQAKALALQGAREISFEGKQFRTDIADEVIED